MRRFILALQCLALTVLALGLGAAPARTRALSKAPTSKEGYMKMQAKTTGQGTPLVLVPGGLTGWLGWDAHAARLSSKRKVIQVQLLNVEYGLDGRSLPAGYSVKAESGALAATIGDLGLKDPLDFVAWSFGAEVTLDFALDHPRQVRSLVLIEPPAFWVLRAKGPLDAETARVASMLQLLREDITEDQLAQFLQTVGFLQPGQNARVLPQWPLWVRHRRSLRNSPAVVSHADDAARLRAFQPPVLLVKGTGSAGFLHQIISALAYFLPHAELVEMPSGHAPQIVSMDRFLAKLESFQALAAR